MTRDQIIAELLRHRAALEAKGVAHLYLFGSVARGEAGPGSDVDLFFDLDGRRFTILDYAGLKNLANDLMPFEVDIISRGSLDRRIRHRIEAEAVQVF
jgi:hypothetical protein